MCDAREGPSKLLSQYLVDDEYRLLLNDLDAAPLVHTNARVPTVAKCGHRQFGETDFVAPEQLWPHPLLPFEDSLMPGYNEKVDIWRLPKTMSTLLGAPSPEVLSSQLLSASASASPPAPSKPAASINVKGMKSAERLAAAAQIQSIAQRCTQTTPSVRPKASVVASDFSRFVKLMIVTLKRTKSKLGKPGGSTSDGYAEARDLGITEFL